MCWSVLKKTYLKFMQITVKTYLVINSVNVFFTIWWKFKIKNEENFLSGAVSELKILLSG